MFATIFFEKNQNSKIHVIFKKWNNQVLIFAICYVMIHVIKHDMDPNSNVN